MENGLKPAKYQGKVLIGNKELPCAVLEDGTRILTNTAIFRAFDRPRRGNTESRGGGQIPSFLDAKNLQSLIEDSHLFDGSYSIRYISQGRVLTGYRAEILPKICDIYLEARATNILTTSQLPLALAAEILVRALSKVGIAALIDEATGYQKDREQNDLQRLLEKYLSAERLAWAKMFPDEFYKQLFRLRGWSYNPLSVKRPQYVGTLTNLLVYEKLPPTVLEELKKRNPVKNKQTWRREATHHQHLSEEIGQKDLHDHLMQIIAIMRISPDWETFIRHFNKAFPADTEQLNLIEFND